eukprot:503071-Amorphochlora_amoeboformis.AAC.1
MFSEIKTQENLSLIEAGVDDLVVEPVGDAKGGEGVRYRVSGVVLEDGKIVRGGQVVIASGTFLRGNILIGPTIRQIGGRRGDGAAFGLSSTLM